MNTTVLTGFDSSRYGEGISREESIHHLMSARHNPDNSNFFGKVLIDQQNIDFYLNKNHNDVDDSPKEQNICFRKARSKYENNLPLKHIDSEEERNIKGMENSRNSEKLEQMIISLSQKQSFQRATSKKYSEKPVKKVEKSEEEKKKEKQKKQNKYFAELLENNLVMQSAKKEKQNQQENIRQYLEQENRYLKNVYGKHFDQNQFINNFEFNNAENQSQNQDSQQYNGTISTKQDLKEKRERAITVPLKVTYSDTKDLNQYSIANSGQFKYDNQRMKKGRLFTFCQALTNQKDQLNDSQILDEIDSDTKEDKKKKNEKQKGLIQLIRVKGQNSKHMNNLNSDIPSNLSKKIGIYTKIHKFLQNLKLKSGHIDPKMLTDYRLSVIGDLSFSTLDNSYHLKNYNKDSSIKIYNSRRTPGEISTDLKKLYNNFSKKCSLCFDKIPIIDPSSFSKQLWDLFILFYIFIAVVIIPIDKFILHYTQTASLIVDFRKSIYSFFTVVSLVDILSKFCIGIYHQGEIILNRKIIAHSYFRGLFILDILTFIPVILRILNNQPSVVDILIFLKLYQIEKIFYQQYEYQIIRFNKGHFVQLVQIVIADAFIIHLIVSLFVYIGFQEGSNGWINEQNLQNTEWFEIYSKTFFFVLQLHLFQGSGMIAPRSNLEAWFLAVASVLLFASLVRTIKKLQKVMSDYRKKDKEKLKQMRLINIYLRNKNLDQRLKIKIVKYLQFQLNQEQQIPLQQEQYILSQLSDELREQILIESNLPVIQSSTILTKFSLSTQQKASISLEIRTINQNETIFEEGDYSDNPYYYFLKQGEVEFYVESFKGNQQIVSLQKLQKDNWFGEMSFLTQKERLIGVVAKEKCVVYRLSRQVFLNILQENSRDYNRFIRLQDRLWMNEISILKQKCWSCKSFDHTIKNCPLIHFVPDIEKLKLN